jgi:hypothetical protein
VNSHLSRKGGRNFLARVGCCHVEEGCLEPTAYPEFEGHVHQVFLIR